MVIIVVDNDFFAHWCVVSLIYSPTKEHTGENIRIWKPSKCWPGFTIFWTKCQISSAFTYSWIAGVPKMSRFYTCNGIHRPMTLTPNRCCHVGETLTLNIQFTLAFKKNSDIFQHKSYIPFDSVRKNKTKHVFLLKKWRSMKLAG